MMRKHAAARAWDDAELGATLQRYARAVASPSIIVDCKNGIAYLSGPAASDTVRKALEDLIGAHEGVRGVVDRMTVGKVAGTRRHPNS